MRTSIILTMALAAVGLLVGEADAKAIKISGTHSRAEIKSTCDKVGGTFDSDSSGYGCQKKCSKGYCIVGCKNNGKCNGQVPGQTRTGPETMGVLDVLGSSPGLAAEPDSPTKPTNPTKPTGPTTATPQ